MPIVTAAPVSIAGTPPNAYPGNPNIVTGPVGPFEIGSNLYTVLQQLQGGGNDPAKVFKAPSSGASWAQVGGDGPSVPDWFGNNQCFLKEDGTTIQIISMSPGTGTRLAVYLEFDTTAPDAFNLLTSPTYSNLTPVIAINGNTLYAAKHADGSLIAFTNGASPAFVAIRYAGATWGEPFQLNADLTGIFRFARSCACTPEGDSFFFYTDSNSSPTLLQYQIVSATNVVTGPFTLATGIGAEAFSMYLPVVWNNQIIVPTTGGVPGSGLFGIWVGTPTSAPVWSFHRTGINPVGPTGLFIPRNGSIGDLYWPDYRLPPDSYPIYRTSWDGANFGTDEVYYDAILNPPSGGIDPNDQSVDQLSGTRRADGSVALSLQMNYDGLAVDPYADPSQYYLRAGGRRNFAIITE